MNIKDLLNEYKRQTNITNEYIAEHTGVTKSTVSRWCSGQIKRIAPATKQKIADMLGMDIDELNEISSFSLQRPILGTVKAGYGLFAEENLEGYANVCESDYSRGDYFLRVSGDSMIGEKIHDGDLIYVKSVPDAPSGAIAVVLIGEEEVSVKRLIKKPDYWILQAANPAVEPRIFSLQEVQDLPVRVIGKVLFARREFS